MSKIYGAAWPPKSVRAEGAGRNAELKTMFIFAAKTFGNGRAAQAHNAMPHESETQQHSKSEQRCP